MHKQDTINEDVLKRFYNIHKLQDADFLESSKQRNEILTLDWLDFGRVYDFYEVQEFDKSITVEDVKRASKNFFDGPMSIMTFGAEYGDIDLKQIWKDNFK